MKLQQLTALVQTVKTRTAVRRRFALVFYGRPNRWYTDGHDQIACVVRPPEMRHGIFHFLIFFWIHEIFENTLTPTFLSISRIS